MIADFVVFSMSAIISCSFSFWHAILTKICPTYRDSLGRKQGTAETDRYGKTTFRDAQGRKQGSFETDRYGKTTYRDAQGRIQGSKK
jgi:hypothetical protein